MHLPWDCLAGKTLNQCVINANDHINSSQSTNTAQKVLKTGGNVYDLVLAKDRLSKEQLDEMLKPENMTDLRQIPEA